MDETFLESVRRYLLELTAEACTAAGQGDAGLSPRWRWSIPTNGRLVFILCQKLWSIFIGQKIRNGNVPECGTVIKKLKTFSNEKKDFIVKIHKNDFLAYIWLKAWDTWTINAWTQDSNLKMYFSFHGVFKLYFRLKSCIIKDMATLGDSCCLPSATCHTVIL